MCVRALMFFVAFYKDILKKEGCSNGEYFISYELTKEQKEASEFILNEIKNKKNC